ncbi:hypothetical protein CC1G_01962 [Coprinopsis cinerea okayama7|uniref:Homeobox domain-containing protein n=1 Tax=Coprinopsis cinerea (strain Okayama-7 / 130 / ATCC MYA-4618 / FGSC 9003) TaxID=240176 RepID=A8N642_COPC7|nr:hypothetical protein CC1G_01962 [Coprinopsis cinerea okayama7\|eukprot:XP_001830326.2 hypothetical protein CC1G_01962 [Coprinopsis cinerea okayama7\
MPPQLAPSQPYPLHTPMRYDTQHFLPHHDPVDFRAFYPYTPNEVKHRKRTTSAQLKVLETVFKRDTKPNATLRNELAQQLDMTARGVQVWFQNRRAKEKTKTAKLAAAAAAAGKDASPTDAPPTSPSSSSPSSSSQQSPEALKQEETSTASTPPVDVAEHQKASVVSKPVSPPQLHLITDVLNPPAWQDSPVDGPPDSATFLSHNSRASLFNNSDLYSLRRGSLPVNPFPHSSDSTPLDSPSSVEWFDPLSRRRSVDASLQRLASNPYAPIARTKNSALFGPRFGVASPGRFSTNRVSSQFSARPPLHHCPSVPHVNIRRSSMDSRRLGLVLRTTALSPAPATTPYINSRASLPDGNLYAVSSRQVGSPIPGPLPSPNFSFGAASTPSMTSPSSADSERNSPDSLRSFSFPGTDDREDDGGMSPTYDAYSRFGSIVSIATSESSIASSYYPEIGGPRVDQNLTTDIHGRRNSCSPGQFIEFPELDSSAHYSLTENSPLGYPQEDFGIARPQGIVVPELAGNKPYPSPTTAISGQNNPSSNLDPATATIAVPSTVPISRSSELAFALQGQPEKSPSMTTPQDNNQSAYLAFGTDQTSQPSSGDLAAPSSESSTLIYQGNVEGGDSSHSQGPFNPTYPAISDVYTQDGTTVPVNPSLYQVYNDSLNMSALSSIDNSVAHNAEAFPAYS